MDRIRRNPYAPLPLPASTSSAVPAQAPIPSFPSTNNPSTSLLPQANISVAVPSPLSPFAFAASGLDMTAAFSSVPYTEMRAGGARGGFVGPALAVPPSSLDRNAVFPKTDPFSNIAVTIPPENSTQPKSTGRSNISNMDLKAGAEAAMSITSLETAARNIQSMSWTFDVEKARTESEAEYQNVKRRKQIELRANARSNIIPAEKKRQDNYASAVATRARHNKLVQSLIRALARRDAEARTLLKALDARDGQLLDAVKKMSLRTLSDSTAQELELGKGRSREQHGSENRPASFGSEELSFHPSHVASSPFATLGPLAGNFDVNATLHPRALLLQTEAELEEARLKSTQTESHLQNDFSHRTQCRKRSHAQLSSSKARPQANEKPKARGKHASVNRMNTNISTAVHQEQWSADCFPAGMKSVSVSPAFDHGKILIGAAASHVILSDEMSSTEKNSAPIQQLSTVCDENGRRESNVEDHHAPAEGFVGDTCADYNQAQPYSKSSELLGYDFTRQARVATDQDRFMNELSGACLIGQALGETPVVGDCAGTGNIYYDADGVSGAMDDFFSTVGNSQDCKDAGFFEFCPAVHSSRAPDATALPDINTLEYQVGLMKDNKTGFFKESA